MSNKFLTKDGFSVLEGTDAQRTLAQRLVRPADRLRNLYTRFGMRPYRVMIIRTRWSADRRGKGVEELIFQQEILPTPKITDLGTLTEVLNPTGLDEGGTIQVSEISGRFTEDLLIGIDPEGRDPLKTDNVYYEIEFPRLDGKPGTRRRFGIRAAPTYRSDQFQWIVTLEKIDEDRGRQGELR